MRKWGTREETRTKCPKCREQKVGQEVERQIVRERESVCLHWLPGEMKMLVVVSNTITPGKHKSD